MNSSDDIARPRSPHHFIRGLSTHSKMAADLRRWDDDCVDELCDLVFGQFLLGNMYRHATNDYVWEEITHTLNAWTGKAFTKRQVIRKFISL
nr:hypothetical protein CFP56_08517 [Quercus suber]